jgi:hypothetical protein
MQTEEIANDLSSKGHKVRNIINIRHRITKDPLPLFYIDLEPHQNNKEIYAIEFLCHTKITVEPPRKRNSPIQCTRCQSYGHSKTYCTRPYSCVKCGRAHDSRTCQKSRQTPATCALCNGNHPANYKGCTVYRDLIQQKSTTYKPTPPPSPDQTQHYPPIPHQGTTNVPRSTPPRPIRPTYAQMVRNESPSPTDPHGVDPLTTTLNTFLSKFQELFNQLINQNSTILTLLTTLVSKLAP